MRVPRLQRNLRELSEEDECLLARHSVVRKDDDDDDED